MTKKLNIIIGARQRAVEFDPETSEVRNNMNREKQQILLQDKLV
jgi:hypothetical protein